MSRKEKDTNDQEYCFLQEAVQEPHKRKPAGILKRAVYVIVLAVVFGGTASVTFWKVQDVLEKRDARIYRESLLNDAKETSAGTKQTPRPSTESDMLAAYENYWDRIKNIGEQCNKAIVTVDKLHTESWYQRSDKEDVLQSGLIFKRRGSSLYVLTQVSSLVEKGSLEVSFANGKSAAATLVATDDNLGIAVLRMDVNDISKSTMNQIYVIDFTQDASDTALELNDRVLLFGCPNGIMKSVMPGNVVNTDMTVQAVDDCLTVYVTDIAYTEGGDGFVSDIEGRMVGMITDAYQRTTGDTNWAFISAEDIAVAAEAIVEEKTPVTFGIRGKDMENGKGIYVTEVLLKSPAYHGGVRVADVIDSIDGNKIRSMKDLSLCLSTHERGDRITVGLCRSCSGKQKKKSVKVELK